VTYVMLRGLRLGIVVLVLIGLDGCGNSSKATATAGFVARAAAICATEKLRASASVLGSDDGGRLTSIAAGRARIARDLSALRSPSDVTTAYRRLVSLIAREAVQLREVAKSLKIGNDARALGTERALRSNAVSRAALLVGLPECG
jgi:hypothetical protein